MAAPTAIYCDWAAGNDYKGATFADGAYTQATKNLNKTGAFAASQVGHWLKISGTHITTGYYKIATKTDNDNVILATDASSDGSNSTDVACTQADGSITTPWRSIQGALDLCTRDATNGNQINIKSGAAQVMNGTMSITTYGTPAEGAPLVLRGYTSTAGDGGIGEIDAGGFGLLGGSGAWTDIGFADLEMHTFGNNTGLYSYGARTFLFRCEVHKGASSPSSKPLVNSIKNVIGCYIHDAGTGGIGASAATLLYGCIIAACNRGVTLSSSVASCNIIIDCDQSGIQINGDYAVAINNTIYIATACTGKGIDVTSGNSAAVVLNNVIQGYSGSGGIGISGAADIAILGYNAFYNNATAESLADVLVDLGNDATLAASPFTDAAGGDFSLNTAVAGAIDGAYPGAWPGLATTVDHADIGAVQNGAGSGGGGAVRIMPVGKVGL